MDSLVTFNKMPVLVGFSAAVISTTIKSDLGRKGFISPYTSRP